MPLVILCGFPASGKTTLANQLAVFLQENTQMTVQVVNDEFLRIENNCYFANAVEEKKCRAALLAASERFVKKDTIVIVDAMNYIKGFRYQLYCQARAAGTPSLALHCEAREDCCRAWNEARAEQHRKYPQDQLEDLFLRFEAPNNQTKWDSPLFTIITEGASPAQLNEFFASLLPVLTSAPSRPPSAATQSLTPEVAASSSQILDSQTQQLIEQVLQAQQSGLSTVRFSGSERTIALHRPVSIAQLSRIRRQFLQLHRLHPTSDSGRIRDLFIEYLSTTFYSLRLRAPGIAKREMEITQLAQLIDPIFVAYAALIVMAVIPIFFGSFQALEEIKKEEAEKMNQSDAYWFPVIGSGVLFGFYLIFKFFSKEYINLLLTVYFGIFGASSLGSMLGAAFHGILPAALAMKQARVLALTRLADRKEEWRLEITWPRIVGFLMAAGLAAFYSYSKNWLASNLFGMAFALSAITMLHLDSFKTGMTLLAGLFVYDVFWVFGTDVMVSVAKSFNAPVKLLFPRNIFVPQWWAASGNFTMLGLGDIVIPGVMVALCLRFDEHVASNKKSFAKPYFWTCFIAYWVGLITTMVVMHTFKAAQPALLYLSPACILAPLSVAVVRGELKALLAYSTEEPEKTKAE